MFCRYQLFLGMVCFYLLGIQAAKTVKTSKLSEFLHSFIWKSLRRISFASNPTVNSRSKKMYYFILFGPLALCNDSKDVTTSFYCFDVMGDLLLWETRFSQREECNHQNEGGLTRFRSADYFAVSDGRPSHVCLTSNHFPEQGSIEGWPVREGRTTWLQRWKVLSKWVTSLPRSSSQLQSDDKLI